MKKSAVVHAIAGFLLMLLLCGITNRPEVPVFSADKRVSPLTFDETTLYAPGVRRFEARAKPSWELDVIEMRDVRFSYPILHQIVLGIPALFIGTETVWRLAHVLLPACVWLLFFLWVLEARGNSPMAFAAAWMAVVIAAAPRNALLGAATALKQPMEFTRMPHPALSTLLLLVALLALCRVLEKERTSWLWIAGPLFGLLFYAYYFHAVAAWTLLGGVWLCLVFRRDPRWKTLMWVAVSGLLVAVPYILWTVESMRSGVSRHLMARIGEFTREPSWVAMAGLGVSAFFFVRGARRSKIQVWLLCGLFTGAFVVANLHLITGYNAQHEHVWNRILQPFGVILAACLLPWRGAWLHGVSALVIALATVRQMKVAEYQQGLRPLPQALMTWLAKHDSDDMVIGVLYEDVRGSLPALTRHWNFVPIGFRTLVSNEEILTRFAIVARLSGLTLEDAKELLTNSKEEARPYAYGLLDDYAVRPHDLAFFEKIWPQADDFAPRKLDLLILPANQAPAPLSMIRYELKAELDGWKVWRVLRFKTPPLSQ
ncbi:MAG: hypothetical protein JNG86_05365 [Verrucomicrobiaceae bacterium]|nr:hypothetical protein [Verrucomicrobiaceae bacterium]